MFYGEESVSALIKCLICKLKLKEAKILPCGLFCNDCVNKITANNKNNEFNCGACHKDHVIPQDGFMLWKALENFYSNELAFEEIYRGESAQRLNTSLKQIRQQIDDISFGLKYSTDVVKDYFRKLRDQVILETEITISQIRKLSDNLINQVNKQETKCILNIESDKIHKEKFDKLIRETNIFHKEWIDYLRKRQIKDSEMDNAFNAASQIEKRLKKEKISLDQYIFNNKLLKYRKSKTQIGENFLGTLELKSIVAIDINKFQLVKLNDILQNFQSLHSIYDFDAFDGGKLAIIYPDTSKTISIAIIDKKQSILNSTNLACIYANHQMRLKVMSSFLFAFYVSENDQYFLIKMNSNLELVKSRSISNCVLKLEADEENIYCFWNQPTVDLIIFGHDLVVKKFVGQSNDPLQPFYFTNQIKGIASGNSRYFCLYNDKIDIMNYKTGFVFKSISVMADRIGFDNESNLLVLSLSSSAIFVYSSFGILIEEIELENVPNGFEFCSDAQGKIVFFNREQCSFYLVRK